MKQIFQNILLVDDSANDVLLVKEALKKAWLYNTIMVAEDGVEALDFLYRRGKFSDYKGKDPIFILLDIKMQLMDGIEVLKNIRADEAFDKIPVIMLTSSKNSNDLKECYRNGANSYVVKPVHVNDFMRVVHEIGKYWVVINEIP